VFGAGRDSATLCAAVLATGKRDAEEVKGAAAGTVDFPSAVNSRSVESSFHVSSMSRLLNFSSTSLPPPP
jgi:hypothetical protein